MIQGYLERGPLRKLHRILQFGAQVVPERQWSTVFKITVKFFDSPLPTVAFIGHQTLERCQGRWLVVRARFVFNRAGKGRHLVELCVLSEVSSNLCIRV